VDERGGSLKAGQKVIDKDGREFTVEKVDVESFGGFDTSPQGAEIPAYKYILIDSDGLMVEVRERDVIDAETGEPTYRLV
jgi:hypothetical protein